MGYQNCNLVNIAKLAQQGILIENYIYLVKEAAGFNINFNSPLYLKKKKMCIKIQRIYLTLLSSILKKGVNVCESNCLW